MDAASIRDVVRRLLAEAPQPERADEPPTKKQRVEVGMEVGYQKRRWAVTNVAANGQTTLLSCTGALATRTVWMQQLVENKHFKVFTQEAWIWLACVNLLGVLVGSRLIPQAEIGSKVPLFGREWIVTEAAKTRVVLTLATAAITDAPATPALEDAPKKDSSSSSSDSDSDSDSDTAPRAAPPTPQFGALHCAPQTPPLPPTPRFGTEDPL